ncbi:Hsp20/alpha crystallin family protein [Bernardetia sp. OM2101]|uniref:Hsp20/alpha crystallin family protein n=1 Tax=Bernardetia sp. OM2101 TaxID=3344876 RepID=UPI0035D0F30A
MTLIKYKQNLNNSFLPSSFAEFFEQDFLPSNRSMFGSEIPMPAVNISENENEHLIEVSAAGFEKDQFNIEMEDNKLTISAEMKEEKEESSNEDSEDKKQNYYTRREFRSSSFKRSFTLPKNVDSENIAASYQNGILKLILPKKAEVINKKKVSIS